VPGALNPVPVKITPGGMPKGLVTGKLLTTTTAPTDIVVANGDSSSVRVLRNSGTGAFTSSSTYTTSLMPQSVAIGDFDKDGKMDVVTGNVANKNVSVLPGKGDRTFLTRKDTAAVHTPGQNIVPVMLPGDTNLDVVLPDSSHGGVIVMRGKGDGTFQAPEILPGGTQSYGVGVGDLNRDDIPDLVSVNHGSGDIGVFVGEADGGFEDALLFRVVPSDTADANSVTVADFNQDGLDDVAVTLSGGQVRVLLNASVFVSSLVPSKTSLGAGTFVTGTITLSGLAPEGGAVVSLTLDDDFDPAISVPPTVTVPAGERSVTFDIVGRHAGTSVLRASFNGLYKEVTLNVTTGTTPPPDLAGDLDGDGKLTLNDVTMLLRIVGGTGSYGN